MILIYFGNIERQKAQIIKAQEILKDKKKELKGIQDSYKKTTIALENAKLVKNSYVKDLTADELNLKNQVDSYEREIRNIDSVISLSLTGYVSAEYTGGMFAWPVPGQTIITSPFGMRFHPILKIYRMHNGLDIGAPSGSNVVAVNDGVVMASAYVSSYGNMVLIDHGGGVSTIYAHASELIANVGDTVKRGDVIMKVGSTGLSTGPHLHFAITVNGTYINPYPYITSEKEIETATVE